MAAPHPRLVALSLFALAGACGPAESGSAPAVAELVQLPEASAVEVWSPPEPWIGPALAVLREGAWALGKCRFERGDEAQVAELRRALALAGKAAPQVPRSEHGPERDTLPATPALICADREAPWGALRELIARCHGDGLFVRVELGARPAGAAGFSTLRVPLGREAGSICSLQAAGFERRLVLGPARRPRPTGRIEDGLPREVTFVVRQELEACLPPCRSWSASFQRTCCAGDWRS